MGSNPTSDAGLVLPPECAMDVRNLLQNNGLGDRHDRSDPPRGEGLSLALEIWPGPTADQSKPLRIG